MKLSEIIRYYPFKLYNFLTKNDIYMQLNKKDNLPVGSNKEASNSLRKYAEKHTPFYKDNSDFPVVNKSIIQNNINDFISRQYKPNELLEVKTSGSSGTPSLFYRNKNKKIRQIADVLYWGKYNNYFFGVKHAFIRGVKKSKKSLFIQNEIHLSPNNLGVKAMGEYYIQLKKVSHIVGFPSVLLNFIDFCNSYNIPPLKNIDGITCTAEALNIEDRKKIEVFFNCKVLTRYASEEVGLIANRLPYEDFYRINHDSIKLDIYKIDSDQLQDNGEEGRIVITDLYSHAMPLINYDTGDTGIVEEQIIGGKPTRVLKTITGRLVDQLYDQNDEKLSPFAINVFLKDFEQIGQFQFVQKDKAQYELLITNKINSNYKEKLTAGLHKIIGKNTLIEIKILDEIPSLASGKRPYIRNEYNKE